MTNKFAWQWMFLVVTCVIPASLSANSSPDPFKEGKVTVFYFNDYHDDQQLKIDAQVGITLSSAIEDALINEVPLTFETEIELNEQYQLLGFNAARNRVSISYQTKLHYYGYNQTYVLINQRNHKVQSFSQLADALKTLGTLDNFTLTDLTNLHPKTLYFVQLRVRFRHWELPAPMMIETLFAKGWRLSSDWHEIEIYSPNSWL